MELGPVEATWKGIKVPLGFPLEGKTLSWAWAGRRERSERTGCSVQEGERTPILSCPAAPLLHICLLTGIWGMARASELKFKAILGAPERVFALDLLG